MVVAEGGAARLPTGQEPPGEPCFDRGEDTGAPHDVAGQVGFIGDEPTGETFAAMC